MDNLEAKPVTGPVTDVERSYAVDALTTTQAALHDSLANLLPDQLTFKPGNDRWSIAECTEHIALIEKGILRAIQASMSGQSDPEKRAAIRVSDIDVIKAVRSRSVTLPAPAPFQPTGRYGDTASALLVFDEQRQATLTFIKTATGDLRTHYFDHIALGTLDIYQAILLMAAHSERHRKQIEEVKNAPGFPHQTGSGAT